MLNQLKKLDNINDLKHKHSELAVVRENSNEKVLNEKRIKRMIN